MGQEDSFYFKTHGYSINCQAIVDSRRRFLDWFLGMPGSTIDAQVLRQSSLYHLVQNESLFHVSLAPQLKE